MIDDKEMLLDNTEKLQCSLISKYSYKQVKDVITEASLWQHEKNMNHVIQKGGVCPVCSNGVVSSGSRNPSTNYTCPNCDGTGLLPDITVRDAINKVKGD